MVGALMKPVQLYQELKNLAEKVGLQVTEQNFRTVGIHVRSGYCRVKEQDWCIIDKHIKLAQKIDVLAECLSVMSLDSLFILPAVREFLEGFKPKKNPEEAVEEEYSPKTGSGEVIDSEAPESEGAENENPDQERPN
jgi:hypothetical protein